MNVKPLEELAEWLEAGAPHTKNVVGFSMTEGIVFNDISTLDTDAPFPKVINTCGAVCCLAGALVSFNTPTANIEVVTGIDKTFASWPEVRARARDIAGLDAYDTEKLFEPADADFRRNVTPAQTARVLRHFIATGSVDWGIV